MNAASAAVQNAVDTSVRPVIDAIVRSLSDGVTGADRSISVTLPSIAGRTIVISVRTGEAGVQSQPPAPARGLDQKQLQLVDEAITEKIGEPITVSMLSSIAGLSRSYFSLAFRISTGRSPHAHVVQRRIERAMNIMRDTNAQLSDIALCSGFSDQAHFSNIFRRKTGMTPSQWRRMHDRTAMQ